MDKRESTYLQIIQVMTDALVAIYKSTQPEHSQFIAQTALEEVDALRIKYERGETNDPTRPRTE